MSDFVLKSGVSFTVTPADLDSAFALHDAIGREITLGNFIQANADVDMADAIQNPAAAFQRKAGSFVEAIKAVAVSVAVRQAAFDCFQRSTWNNLAVTKELFNSPKWGEKARSDYYEMVLKLIEVNCRPFFVNLLSMLSTQQPTISKDQLSK